MLQYFYDDASGIVDISLRCRLYRTQVKSSAEEGEASISTLIIDDPNGDLIIDPFRQIYIVETTAPVNEQVVYRGYVSDKEIRRGPYRNQAGREWVVQLSDPNWLIGLRIIVGSDANRPAETDLERVQWLLTTTEANTFNGDDTYVNTTASTVAMDAADYRGQNVSSILDDCAQATGKNWWVVYFEAIGQYGLWYDFPSSSLYVSPISLSNKLTSVNNSTVFAISQENTTLERSPSRLVSGVYLPYDGGNVYVQNTAVGSNTIFRDAAAPSVNVKTSAKATARANRYLADNATEEDVIRTEVLLPADQVNDVMQGQLIDIEATHLPGYETTRTTRVLNRTVTETSEEFLTVGLELSPFPTTGAYMMSFLIQRDITAYGADVAPRGTDDAGMSYSDPFTWLAGTTSHWAVPPNSDPSSYPLDVAYLEEGPTHAQWVWGSYGGFGLAGTARPTGFHLILSGAEGPPVYLGDTPSAPNGTTFYSDTFVASDDGVMFCLLSGVRAGDAATGPFTVTGPSGVTTLRQAWASDGAVENLYPNVILVYKAVTAGQSIQFTFSKGFANEAWNTMVVFVPGSVTIDQFVHSGSAGGSLAWSW